MVCHRCKKSADHSIASVTILGAHFHIECGLEWIKGAGKTDEYTQRMLSLLKRVQLKEKGFLNDKRRRIKRNRGSKVG